MPKLQTLKPRVKTMSASRVQQLDRGTAHQRGYDYRWQRAREAFLRENPLCVMCLAERRTTAATVVDHIIPHRGDGALFWDRSNWQSLCQTHHSSHKQRMEREGLA